MGHPQLNAEYNAGATTLPAECVVNLPAADQALDAVLADLSCQLDRFINAFTARQQHLDERQQRLEQEAEQLDRRRGQLESGDRSLAEYRHQVEADAQRQADEIKQQAAALREREEALGHRARALDGREQGLKRQAAELQDLQAANAETQATLADQLAEREADIQRRHDELEQSRAELDLAWLELREEREALASDRAALDAELATATDPGDDLHAEESAGEDQFDAGEAGRGTPEHAFAAGDVAARGAVVESQEVIDEADVCEAAAAGRPERRSETGSGHGQPQQVAFAARPLTANSESRADQPAYAVHPQPVPDAAAPPGGRLNIDAMNLDPRVVQKFKLLRRLAGAEKTDPELLAQARASADDAPGSQQSKKRWWRK